LGELGQTDGAEDGDDPIEQAAEKTEEILQ
jgi:hypothetical protein